MLLFCFVIQLDISSQENGDVPTKVYVGGIPYYSTEDDIRSYFESCGTITEVDCMCFPETGKFRGIAIISFKVSTKSLYISFIFFKKKLTLHPAPYTSLLCIIQFQLESRHFFWASLYDIDRID